MATMGGQPQSPAVLEFNVTNLEVFEPAGAVGPAIIIPTGSSFDIAVTFDGAGLSWTPYEVPPLGPIAFDINYYAEGFGVGAPEVDLGVVHGSLSAAGGPYTNPLTRLTVPANTLLPGVYNMSCLVTFPAVPGMTGFYEGLIIQVY